MMRKYKKRKYRRITPKTWAKAEREYFEGEFSISEIAKHCECNPATLYARAKKLKWPPHASLRLEGGFSERASLRRIIAGKLTQLEKRMKDPEIASDADTERQVRAAASLLGTVDKLDAKEKTWRETVMPASADGPAAPDYGDDNVDQWRRDLAKRIASLGAKWNQ